MSLECDPSDNDGKRLRKTRNNVKVPRFVISSSESDSEENCESDYMPEDSPKRKRETKTTAKVKATRKPRTKVEKTVAKPTKRATVKATKRDIKHTDSNEEDNESKPKKIKLDEESAGTISSNKAFYEDKIEPKPRNIIGDEESASTSRGIKKYNYDEDDYGYESKPWNFKTETDMVGNFTHGNKDVAYEDNIEHKSGRLKLEEDLKIDEHDCKSETLKDTSKPDLKARSRKNEKTKVSDKKGQDAQKYEIKGAVNADWDEAEEIADFLRLPYYIVKNIIRLFNEDNTIPFIARYRKEMTGNMDPEKLREVKEAYETLQNVKKKAVTMINAAMKLGKLNKTLEYEILSARTMSELDHIYSSFKASGKGTLAERARELGLETPAMTILCGNSTEPIVPAQFVCHQRTKGMASPKEVESGMKHIIADCISKDKGIRDLVRKLKSSSYIMLVCTKSKTTAKPATKKKSPAKPTKQSKSKATASHAPSADDESKYQNYFDFKINVRQIRPHQVLAINRGEKHKFLSVKLDVPKSVHDQLYQFVQYHWLNQGLSYPLRYQLVRDSFDDAYERLILPFINRQIRAELTQIAESASIDVFAANLKNLLLQPPFRGKVVMGIDPGYRNGCKMAVISARGNVLRTDVLYPDFNAPDLPFHQDTSACKLIDCVLKFRCETIALGNGTACRETEEYLSRLIQSGCFKPHDVMYTIVSEQGASIYSCSPEAHKEFPDLDVNLISAVSIARRLQDPMGEFVKIEARHLGVGMYQHDLPDSKLRTTLDEVVVECVSFVGVDLNVASHSLLRRIAGLNPTRAQNIIDWRNSNGPFCNREQIKEVKGIGGKTFEQCAGFVRILPQSCRAHRESLLLRDEPKGKGKAAKSKEIVYRMNPLDTTWIHPESYDAAENIIKRCGLYVEDVGLIHFIESFKSRIQNIGINALSQDMKISRELAKLITDGLMQPPDHDLRSEFSKPLFHRRIKSFEDIRCGDLLSGKVRNVTHFGAFVDVGVGRDGLIPSGRLPYGTSLPQLGDRVKVQIAEVDIQRRRITLDLVAVE